MTPPCHPGMRTEVDHPCQPHPAALRPWKAGPAGAGPEPPLLRRLAQGDPNAFWGLWLLHHDYLFHLCLQRMDARPADAEDALARVRQKALAGLPRVARQMANLKGWLGRIAVNVCCDIHRENQCRHRASQELDQALDEADETCASSAADPGEALLEHELEEFLRSAIGELPANLRAAAELFLLQDCSPEEVARSLAITLANGHKRIQRARALLKEAVKEYLSAAVPEFPLPRPPNCFVCPKSVPSSVLPVKAHETARTRPGQKAFAIGARVGAGDTGGTPLPPRRVAGLAAAAPRGPVSVRPTAPQGPSRGHHEAPLLSAAASVLGMKL
jgi:RNA polymerase sigma factor (sigma-70 family)